eukprot:3686579-Pleurochrysis_carterae.AAC.5
MTIRTSLPASFATRLPLSKLMEVQATEPILDPQNRQLAFDARGLGAWRADDRHASDRTHNRLDPLARVVEPVRPFGHIVRACQGEGQHVKHALLRMILITKKRATKVQNVRAMAINVRMAR